MQSRTVRFNRFFCGPAGYDIIDCFNILAAEAVVKADGVLDKKKPAALDTSASLFRDLKLERWLVYSRGQII